MLVVRRSETVSCSRLLVLLLAEEAVAVPLRQELAGTQGLLARFRVESHAGPPKAPRDQDQHDDHRDCGEHEVHQDEGAVRSVAEEHRADTDVAVDGGVGHEGKLPPPQAPGERRSACDQQTEQPQAVLLRSKTPERMVQKRTLATMLRYVPRNAASVSGAAARLRLTPTTRQ